MPAFRSLGHSTDSEAVLGLRCSVAEQSSLLDNIIVAALVAFAEYESLVLGEAKEKE